MNSNREKTIKMYFVDKLKPVDIAQKLKISKSAVTQFLNTDFRYREEKSIRKKLNKIKNKEETKDYIKNKRKNIQFRHSVDDLILKNMHIQASIELSQPKKLSDMAYRNWNKSAYTYNQKKNRFEFRKELGRSNDVPKYIKVEV